MNPQPLANAIKNLVFPGSAIIAGKSHDGTCGITAYFITGVNAADRARVFTEEDNGIRVASYPAPDNSSYTAAIDSGSMLFIGNGSHTSRLAEAYENSLSVREVIASLPCLENGQPRISTALSFEKDNSYINMSIVKQESNALMRHSFEYSGLPDGVGFMMTALSGSEYPFAPFSGDPVAVQITGSIFDVVADIWENLRPETRVSLWVKSTDLTTGKSISRIINRNR